MSQPNVWIIDHRDSFTWNLAELVRKTGMAVPRVVSNESPELEQAVQAGEKLILSPGPGTVEDDCHRATFRLLERLGTDPQVYYLSKREWVRRQGDNYLENEKTKG